MLYYSHVNEDNRVERTALFSGTYEAVACIAGSGERVMALLDYPHAADFYVIDYNPEALYLTELKLVALGKLGTATYLRFIGFVSEVAPHERVNLLKQLLPDLSNDCRRYWQQHLHWVQIGVLYAGHFERFLHRVRPYIRLLLGNSFYNAAFGANATPSGQLAEYRWLLLCLFFSQRWVYQLFGNQDLAFVHAEANVSRIPQGMNQLITQQKAACSFMFHLVFKGHLLDMKAEDLPPSLQPELLDRVSTKLNEHSLRLHYCTRDWNIACRELRLNQRQDVFYSLSDILSFAPIDYVHTFLDQNFKPGLQHKSAIFRSFLRNQLSPPTLQQLMAGMSHLSFTDLSAAESSNMYQVYAAHC
jgi:S-adenosylmethionine:diacylglycerol 3-amino-3-carboxypropyl transferase